MKLSEGIKVAKNLITKKTLNKKALAESSLIYIFADDLITPGAKDLIREKKLRCKYIKKEELKAEIRKIIEELTTDQCSSEKKEKIIKSILAKII